MLYAFGGIARRQGPHTTAGWLALMVAMGCLPCGVLTLLLVHGIALAWRRFLARQGFALIWLAFIVIAAAAAALVWLLVAVLNFRLVPAGPALFQAAVSAALYPALAIPLAAAHASLANPERA